MAITHVVSASAQATDGGNPSVSLGSSLQENDVAVIIAAAGVGSTPTMSTSGYNTLVDNLVTLVAWKRMGATPDTTAVVAGNGTSIAGVSASVIVLRGVDITTALDATSTEASNAGSTNPDPPSITTVTNGAAVVALMATKVNDSTVTAPSGYSNGTSLNSNDTSPVTTGAAWILKASAGAENPPAFTNVSSGQWKTVTVALRPAPPAKISVFMHHYKLMAATN